ncbi:hypothetical protein MA5S0422_2778 [Mycobacteroides abscessus 5S-0422]|nr:hypothetical protein MA5S0304_1844 [Mycobacteroides abscessus 5S-0304]EIU12722.1 hypothetical protein MA5S0421_2097 [Mycobacteroides abscessus 5S-0421]EIU13255.1 hypothetical protein MA5S0422_2778 [Mycobacteroides abscessus 5S-0422]EIU22032.1 hypothetical protein MA5S0708_4864 [Mycobacteroides abscessus 5S-0708]EIU23374.1 hypothetical protein MA5S0817_5187 [Mycobacteroides abscessus 5S-0817]EIU30687.1 hypothetical protein MA5S1212_4574 [Mycobacteroides abscessus 5S-1212]EIU42397.1 hypothet
MPPPFDRPGAAAGSGSGGRSVVGRFLIAMARELPAPQPVETAHQEFT